MREIRTCGSGGGAAQANAPSPYLDGGMLGGILLTGGSGGINFKNSFADPCDFESYIDFDNMTENFPAAGTLPDPNNPNDPGRPANPEEIPFPLVEAGYVLSCVDTPFPPKSVNPLCEIHPVTGKAVFKLTTFSSGDATQFLSDLGITPATTDGLTVDAIVGRVVTALSAKVVLAKNQAMDALGGAEASEAHAYMNSLADQMLASFDDAARTILRSTIREFVEGRLDVAQCLLIDPTFRAANPTVYDLVHCMMQAGIPCFDTTLQLAGTFSHSAISTVLNGTGKVTLSTTGTAVLDGSINLIGIPVGTAKLAFSLTDSTGNINPAFGGLAEAALGPLELGSLSMALQCDGCFDAMITNFSDLLICLGAPGEQFAFDMLDQVFPEFAPWNRGAGKLPEHYASLQPRQQLAYIASFFNYFQVVANNTAVNLSGEGEVATLPFAFDQVCFDDTLACFREFVVNVMLAFDPDDPTKGSGPSICFSGSVGPELFGIPLTGGADSTLATSMLYRLVDDNGTTRQELVSTAQFSPSQMLMSAIMGSYAYALPAVDQSLMGYSLRTDHFNPENVETLLRNPAEFAGEQLTQLVEEGTLTFGYQLRPLGYQLANGQARMIMPRIQTHPAGGTPWINPDTDDSLPSRMEIILTALSKGQIQNPQWRGTPDQLGQLFLLPGTSDCDTNSDVVRDRIDLDALATKDLASHYFPHGGIVGGAEFDLPNAIADAPPTGAIARLFRLPSLGSPDFSTDAQEWLANAQFLFADPDDTTNSRFNEPGYAYFTGTTCTGQMAFYLPAPNPPNFDFANGTLTDFIDQLKTGDLQAIVDTDRSVPNPASPFNTDLILLKGWMDVPIMGLPVARGSVDYNPGEQCFLLDARVLGAIDGEDPSWLHKLIGGSLVVEMKASDGLADDGTTVGGSSEQLADLGATLKPGIDMAAFVANVSRTMPKASARAGFTLDFDAILDDPALGLPTDLSEYIRMADAEAEFFAFSPFFDPQFGTADGVVVDESPLAVARRRGGMGMSAGFEFGYFPPRSTAAEQLVFKAAAKASFALTPDADIGLFPAFVGEIEGSATLPYSFTFDGTTTKPFVFDGMARFNSSPEIGEEHLFIDGGISAFDLGPFLRVSPLAGARDGLIGGSLHVTRTNQAQPAIGLTLNPAQAEIPIFGSIKGSIYGGTIDHTTRDTADDVNGLMASLDQNAPFTFSTLPGQDWSAVVQLDGKLEVRSPLNLKEIIFEAEPATQNRKQVPFVAQVAGTGLESFEVRLTIPNGLVFTLFPGTAHASTYQVGDNSATCLLVNSDGRIYFDSGTRTLDLAGGLGSVMGRIELGYEPLGGLPVLSNSQPVAVAAALGNTNDQTLTITNRSRNASQLIVDASLTDSTHFSVTPSRLILGAGESAPLTIRFAPRSSTIVQPRLLLANNSATPLVEIPLNGVVRTEPNIHVHTARVDFGLTPLGTSRSEVVRVTNTGDANLNCTSIATSAGEFTDDRTTLTVAPNQSRDILVTFTPTNTAAKSATLTFSTNDPDVPLASVALNGQGNDRFWYRQRRGSSADSLAAIGMRPDGKGYAAGPWASYFEAEINGRSWTGRDFPLGVEFQDLAVIDNSTAWAVALADSAQAHVWRTTNGGTNWSRQTSALLNNSSDHWRGVKVITGTGRVVIVGDRNGAPRIVVEGSTDNYDLGVITGGGAALLDVAFGTTTTGVAVGANRTILVTTDGGKTWNRNSNIPTSVPTNTTLRGIAANPESTSNYIIVGDNGTILRSVDRGVSWQVRDSRNTSDLHDVVRGEPDRFFAVGDDGTVLRGDATGSNWTAEDALTSSGLRGVTVVGQGTTSPGDEVWAVSRSGDVFHRLNDPVSGPILVVNSDESLDFGNIGVGERLVGEVIVSNEGIDSGQVGIGSDNSEFAVDPKDDQTVLPGDSQTFTVTVERNNSGAVGANLTFTSSDKAIDRLNNIARADFRQPRFSPLGYLKMPATIDTGGVIDAVRVPFEITNIGQTDASIHSIEVRHPDDGSLWSTRLDGEQTLSVGDRSIVDVEFTAAEPGIYRALVEVTSDARNGVATVEIVVEVVAEPEVIVVRSEPPGMQFLIEYPDTPSYSGAFEVFEEATAFTVVEGAPTSVRSQLPRGQAVDLTSVQSLDKNGMHWEFQRWRPGDSNIIQFTAGDSASAFVAEFATSPVAGPTVADPSIIVANPCRFEIPPDVSFGPWVRITEAKLTTPWIGDANGSDFAVEGSLFLSLDRAYGSLTSSTVRVLAPNQAPILPPFRSKEMLEITPGSWSFDIDSAGLFSLLALTPGVQVLDRSALPPSQLDIAVDLNESKRTAGFRFATLDELSLAPGVLALGPGEVSLNVAIGNETNLLLSVDSSVRALANPTNPSQWIINRPFEFVFDPRLATLGALDDFQTRTQLADLLLVRIHGGQDTAIQPSFNGTTFGLAADNLHLEFFRNGDASQDVISDAVIDSTGTFNFNADLPSAGITAGPVTIRPQSTTGNNERATLTMNPFQALLEVDFPAVFINSSSSPVRWPSNTIGVNPDPVSTANFAFRTAIPSINFDGFGFASRSKDEDNYFEWARTTSSSTVKLRARNELYVGAMKFAFDVSNGDGISGSLSGRLGVENPAPLSFFSDRVSMSYDAGNPPEFTFNRVFTGVGCRIEVSSESPLVQACLLNTDDNEEIENWSKSICFPLSETD
ncbi:MAG: choice-of-anchor D domain-containing protein [Verrucomicrobiales bacterium]